MMKKNIQSRAPSALLLAMLCFVPVAFAAENISMKIEQANAVYSSGDFSGSLSAARKLIELSPKSSDAYTLAGLSSLAMGDLQAAEADLGKALALSPKSSDANNNLGLLLCKTGREEKAIKLFETAQKLDTSHGERAAVNAAICLNRTGDDKKAEIFLQGALKAKPPYPPAFYEMAHLQYRNGRFADATQFLAQFHQYARPNRESLMLAVLIAKADGKLDLQKRYETQLASLEKGVPPRDLSGGGAAGSVNTSTVASSAVDAMPVKNVGLSVKDLSAEQEQLGREQAQKSALETRLREVQLSRAALEAQMREISHEKTSLDERLEKENALRGQLFSKIDEGRGTRSETDMKIAQAERDRAQFESQIKTQHDEIDALARRLAESEKVKKASEKNLDDLVTQKGATQEQLAKAQELTKQLVSQKNTQIEKITELQARIDEERTLVKQVGNSRAAQGLEIEQTQQQLSLVTQERLRVQSTFAETRQSRLAINANLEAERLALQKASTELRSGQAANLALEQQLNLVKNENSTTQQALGKTQGEIPRIEERIVQSKKTGEAKRAELAKLMLDVASRRETLGKATDEESVLQSKIVTVKANIEQTNREIRAAKTETKALSEESTVLSTKLAAAQKFLAQTTAKRVAAVGDLDKVKRNNSELLAAIESAKKQIAETQELIGQTKKDLGNAQAGDAQLRSRLAEANEQFAAAKKAYENSRQDTMTSSTELRDQVGQVARLRQQQMELIAQRDKTIESISNGKAQILSGQNSLITLKSEVERLERQYGNISGDVLKLNENIAVETLTLEKKRAAVSDMNKVVTANTGQLKNTQESLRETNETLVKLAAQLGANETDRKSIKNDKQSLAGKIDEKQKANDQLVAEIARLSQNKAAAMLSLGQLQKDSSALHELLAKAQVETDLQNVIVQQAMDEKSKLDGALAERTAKAADLRASLKTMARQRDEIQAKSAKAVDEAQRIQLEISKTQTQMADLTASSQKKNTEHDNETSGLAEAKAQLAAATEALKTKEVETTLAREQRVKLQQSLVKKAKQRAEAEALAVSEEKQASELLVKQQAAVAKSAEAKAKQQAKKERLAEAAARREFEAITKQQHVLAARAEAKARKDAAEMARQEAAAKTMAAREQRESQVSGPRRSAATQRLLSGASFADGAGQDGVIIEAMPATASLRVKSEPQINRNDRFKGPQNSSNDTLFDK